jgi:hypothetical protein
MTNPQGPVDVVTDIAQDGGQALLSVVGSVLPILIPIFAAFWGIRYALGKLGITSK